MSELIAGNRIVVGVDGSEASTAALRWATEQAPALRAEVVAVHAWEPAGPGLAPYAPVSAHPPVAEQRDRAAELLASTVREVFGPRVDRACRAVLVEGPPARVLLQQAHSALLLAVGRDVHGRDGLPPMGAVGRACLRHATVPVVAVPATAVLPASPLRAVGMSAPLRSGAA
ncbi:universal stress protein [Streptomyces europaeiscabiei]|uniref:universal stress protein n=1 Tax=Streptomyces europaeiscabiei TaxID=146819 RepID=UPI002E0FA18C|nr:universal stress protein [Streptomyces europaeiscabiei]